MADNLQIIPPKQVTAPTINVTPDENKPDLKLLPPKPYKGTEGEYGKPKTLGQKFGERFVQSAAFDVPIGAAFGGLPGAGLGAVTALGSAVGGTGAEALGLSPNWQTAGEIVGGFGPQIGRKIAGKVVGYIEPQLEELAKKASKVGFEIGPGARSKQGMKYGAGETPEASINNLNKFTEEATTRAGSKTKNINGDWIKATDKKLGDEVTSIFKGKKFSADYDFTSQLNKIINDSKGAFADAPNTVESIIENNIKGTRPRGELISSDFAAEDLRKAIVEINQRLSSADGPKAYYLHELKDSLENLASRNLNRYGPELSQRYNTWRSNWNSFSTIKETYNIEGKTGVNAAGQINPQKLLDIISRRTGGNATRNPLYSNLGEYGSILKSAEPTKPGIVKAAWETLSESPLGKALQTTFQPRVLSANAQRAASTMPIVPPLLRSVTEEERRKK